MTINTINTKNTRKKIPWSGWKREKPSYHQKTVMLKKCGQKCFLGNNKKFPICKKNTCKISRKGIYAAYIRARQYHHRKISKKAKKILKNM
jgi:hypothetical protein